VPAATPTASGAAYTSAVLGDRPLGYWRLGERSGTTAQDQVGTFPGTYTGSNALGSTGALAGDADTADGLNGTNAWVSVPYSPVLNPAVFSVELWAYPTGGGGKYRGAASSRSYPNGWVLYAGSNDRWQFWFNSGSGMVTVSGGTVSLNKWQHVVATFDGKTARLYVNGVLGGSGTTSAGFTASKAGPLALGQSEPGTNFWFPGRLDEAAIYGSALTAPQVQSHYKIGTGT
jgi:hypothetical protein